MKTKIKNFSLGLLPLMVAACSTWVERSSYHLEHYDELVVTDSPTQLIQPKKLDHATLEVTQSIIIQNTSDQRSYPIEISKSIFEVKGKIFTPICSVLGKTDDIILEPGKKSRVNCLVVIQASNENQLFNKDSVAALKIPYSQSKQFLQFSYALKVEDFEP